MTSFATVLNYIDDSGNRQKCIKRDANNNIYLNTAQDLTIEGNCIVQGGLTGTNVYLSGDIQLEGRLATTSTIIGIGLAATQSSPGGNNIAIGNEAGYDTQGAGSVAIGYGAGSLNQGPRSVAIGQQAGHTDQTDYTVAIGYNAGSDSQGTRSIAIGRDSGAGGQSNDCIAIGPYAGYNPQTAYSIAIGYNAGYGFQNFDTIAIGRNAGYTGQGRNSIAIGNSAGANVQHANTIILNASGVAVNSDGTDRTFIGPIRNTGTNSTMYYNPTTYEVTYGAGGGGGAAGPTGQVGPTGPSTGLTNVTITPTYDSPYFITSSDVGTRLIVGTTSGYAGVVFGNTSSAPINSNVGLFTPFVPTSVPSNIGLDPTFNPNAGNTVRAIAIQSNGQIVIGGSFATIGVTTRNRIARLNADGTLDTTFDPNVANNVVYAIAIQSNGQIVIGGDFTTVGATTRNRIARLNPLYISSILKTNFTSTGSLTQYSNIIMEKIGSDDWVVVSTNN